MKNKLIKLFVLLLIVFFYSYLGSLVRAEEIAIASPSPELTVNVDKAKQYGVVYPISELGNCGDFTACRAFCGRAENNAECIKYAVRKGFYKKRDELLKRQKLLQRAKIELKCLTDKSCKKFCDIKENTEKCREFLIKHKPEAAKIKEAKNQTLVSKAKMLLGCTTPEECKKLCEEENNKERCSEFFRQLGLRKEKYQRRLENEDEKKSENRMKKPLEQKPFKISPKPDFLIDKTEDRIENRDGFRLMITPKVEDQTGATVEPTLEVEQEKEDEEVKGVSTEDKSLGTVVLDAMESFVYFLRYGTSQ
jgi:hypothetical protein